MGPCLRGIEAHMVNTTPSLIVNTPSVGPGFSCNDEYSAFDSVSPGPLGSVRRMPDDSRVSPTTIEFIEKVMRTLRAAQAAAEAPSRLMSPVTGALGPQLLPLRI